MNDESAMLPHGAITLHEALRKFVPAALWSEYEAEKARPADRIRSADDDYMDLETRRFVAQSNNQASYARYMRVNRCWRRIKRALIEKLIAGDLHAYARREQPWGDWKLIPSDSWSSIRIINSETGTIKGRGFELTDVRIAETGANGPAARTGAPGRPSVMECIEDEFDRRIAAGAIDVSLAREAESLAAWFKSKYPRKQGPTAKTIENKIRAQYRVARKQQSAAPTKL